MHREPVPGEKGGDRLPLPLADLERDEAARCQQPGEVGGERAVGGEAVRPGGKRLARLVHPYFRGEAGEIAQGDIGRVGDDHLERAGEGPAPVALHQGGPPCQAVAAEIGGGAGERDRAAVDPDAEGARPFVQERHEEATTAGAEIEQAQRRRAPRPGGQYGLDHGLGLRPRHQHAWADQQGTAPELALAEERGERLAGVFARLKFEAGVHRVQRVPVTEAQGRIHTSAATVAVLPEAEEIDVQIDDKDLRIDIFRSSGPGGQSVNTTDSAVRITHLPTGIVVSQQDEKSQHKNKAKALRVLRARLFERERQEREAARAEDRKGQIGSGDRSERIRTYNFPQNRVTDHRINLTLYKLDKVIAGEALDEIVEALIAEDQATRLGEVG